MKRFDTDNEQLEMGRQFYSQNAHILSDEEKLKLHCRAIYQEIIADLKYIFVEVANKKSNPDAFSKTFKSSNPAKQTKQRYDAVSAAMDEIYEIPKSKSVVLLEPEQLKLVLKVIYKLQKSVEDDIANTTGLFKASKSTTLDKVKEMVKEVSDLKRYPDVIKDPIKKVFDDAKAEFDSAQVSKPSKPQS